VTVVAKIERIPLRDVWAHEAHDLTRWLEENPDVLSDVLGFSLGSVERERRAGAFSVDLVAEDSTGRAVVIENQLERSNHDHLGKLITYTAMMDAQVAIWIVAEPCPEHVRAISWLNESVPCEFHLLKIEGIQIADSPPAPLLTLIVGPSDETRNLGETKRDLAERHFIRKDFWTTLLDRAKGRTRLHSGISPSHETWISTGAGRSGLAYNYVMTQHRSGVELYIDRGRDSGEDNVRILEELEAHKKDIEAAYGGHLEWQLLEGRRACRIRQNLEGGYRETDLWPSIQDAMIDAMMRLERALKPYIDRLAV
jgi:hypothetical protein